MADFLLELLSEEIPARMQAKAQADLARLFGEQLAAAGLASQGIETYATPRRLTLIARGLPAETEPVREELKGPRAAAPPQALEGFLRKTGLTRDQLEERNGIFFAVTEKPGRTTASVLAEAVPAIVRAFPWPKSMRWGDASLATDSPRWVRPLQGIVALLGEDIVEFEIAGIRSGAATVGHRFHHPGIITIGSANDYVEKLRACHVIVDPAERQRLIRDRAEALAAEAGLALVPDDGLVAENAGLTEWPVPLLGSFDPSFLDVPPEVIQLTMRTNQKYFALTQSSPAFAGEGDRAERGGGAGEAGSLAPNFICTANIEASDGGDAIVAGNRKVLAARLADAKFFWEHDLKIPLEEQAQKLSQIVFHEKLGTVADKVERVAKLARWLVEEGIVGGSTPSSAAITRHSRESGNPDRASASQEFDANALDFDLVEREANGKVELGSRLRGNDDERLTLADQAETAARLCKADLVTGMVGEFPELQGVIGGYLARAQGHPDAVADAIRDHYKPVGQGDEVPTAPVTVAVSLADKLDTIVSFFAIDEKPTGSKDPFALRRAALGVIRQFVELSIRAHLNDVLVQAQLTRSNAAFARGVEDVVRDMRADRRLADLYLEEIRESKSLKASVFMASQIPADLDSVELNEDQLNQIALAYADLKGPIEFEALSNISMQVLDFFADRLKVQQREAGVRHDLIDAVFALGGEDDLVRLLARVKALQSFVETPEGADLLAGYKRAANILKKEGWSAAARALASHEEQGIPQTGEEDPLVMVDDPQVADAIAAFEQRHASKSLSYTPLPEEAALIAALDSAEPRAREAVAREDFEGAMAALATLRAPVDAFFDKVTVNDPDPAKREARLDLLARMRDAVHQVADFSRIEG